MSYSDEDLAQAIKESRSWRGVLRELELMPTSAGSLRSARRRADRLGFDYGHFTGQRCWSDAQLADAVAGSRSWAGVMRSLGLAGGYTAHELRSRAQRLGIESSHLELPSPLPDGRFASEGDASHLRTAASCLAAAWFQLRGCRVSWPLEPARYDLLVEAGGKISRIQVKTTVATASTRGTVSLSTSRPSGRETYRSDEIDYFFIIDSRLDAYLIPVDAVIGKYSIMLPAHESFRVAIEGKWLGSGAVSEVSSPEP